MGCRREVNTPAPPPCLCRGIHVTGGSDHSVCHVFSALRASGGSGDGSTGDNGLGTSFLLTGLYLGGAQRTIPEALKQSFLPCFLDFPSTGFPSLNVHLLQIPGWYLFRAPTPDRPFLGGVILLISAHSVRIPLSGSRHSINIS